MRTYKWLLPLLLAAGLPLSASAGFGFGMSSDDGFHSWDPEDYPYGYPPYGPYRGWGPNRPRRHDKSVHKSWSDKWDDDYTSRFTFGPENFHFGDSWNQHWGDRWGRYRRPWGPPPYGYYPPGWGPYAPPPPWGYRPPRQRQAPSARPSQRIGARPERRPEKPRNAPAGRPGATPQAEQKPQVDPPAAPSPKAGDKAQVVGGKPEEAVK